MYYVDALTIYKLINNANLPLSNHLQNRKYADWLLFRIHQKDISNRMKH